MCTLALYFQECEHYPLIVAANRDEYYTRPSAEPQLLAEKPRVLGGKDLLAGGTWLGINEHGLLVGILNRRGEQEEEAAARSRGLLCLDILQLKSPAEACAFLEQEKGSRYKLFNLLFADKQEAVIAYNLKGHIQILRLEKGLHVLSNTAVYDSLTEKMQHAYFLFSSVEDSLQGEHQNQLSWIPLLRTALSDHTLSLDSNEPKAAICVHTSSYGTVSSSVIFYASQEKRFYSYHAPGPPCHKDYGSPLILKVI